MLVHIIVTQSCSDNKKEFISIDFYQFSYPNAAKSVAATLARTITYILKYVLNPVFSTLPDARSTPVRSGPW